jgi:cellulose synthase operon protein C
MHTIRTTLFALTPLLLLMGSNLLGAAPQGRDSAQLPVSSDIAKSLEVLDELLVAEQWQQAIELLTHILDDQSANLVPVATPIAAADKPQTGPLPQPHKQYRHAGDIATQSLSHLPVSTIKQYQATAERQATLWWHAWEETGDAEFLHRIVRRSPLTGKALSAQLALGDAAWDRGDYSLAKHYWQELMAIANDPPAASTDEEVQATKLRADAPLISARLVLATLFNGQLHAAAAELKAYQLRYPQASGTLAARTGPLSIILQEIFDKRRKDASLNLLANQQSHVGLPRWSFELPTTSQVASSKTIWLKNQPPHMIPTISDLEGGTSVVFANDGQTITGWRSDSGLPIWSSAPNNSPPPAKQPLPISARTLYPPLGNQFSIEPDLRGTGSPLWTISADDRSVLAVMGTGVAGYASSEARQPQSELVCLDLGREGGLRWKFLADDLLPTDSGWEFEGSPLLDGGIAYQLLVRRRTLLEFQMMAIDSVTGEVRWTRPIGKGLLNIPANQNRISHLRLTGGSGLLVVATDCGFISAVHQHDGRLAWSVTYPTAANNLQTRESLAAGSASRVLYANGDFFVATHDQPRLWRIDASSGDVIWSKRLPRQELIPVGLYENTLVIAGQSLSGVDSQTGRTRWTYAPDDPETNGFGTAVMAYDHILFPSRHHLKAIDVTDGQIAGSLDLQQLAGRFGGGHLLPHTDQLIIASPSSITGYSNKKVSGTFFSRVSPRLPASSQPTTPHDGVSP